LTALTPYTIIYLFAPSVWHKPSFVLADGVFSWLCLASATLLSNFSPFCFGISPLFLNFAKRKSLRTIISMAAHNDLGRWGEDKAAEYLESKGYRVVERNWRMGHRDLDIVALDDSTLVIVEVKTRRNDFFMEPEQAVDRKKIRSLTIAANAFVKSHSLGLPIRFDIISVIGESPSDCHINHIENAFIPSLY